MVVKYRHVQAKIYRKSKRYPFYRLAFTAGGKRKVRNFKTYEAVRAAAKRVVRQIAKGNDAAASLNLQRATRLRQSILQKSFSGELTQ